MTALDLQAANPLDIPITTLACALRFDRAPQLETARGTSLPTALRGLVDRTLLTLGCSALPEDHCPTSGAPCARASRCALPWLHKPRGEVQRRDHPSPLLLRPSGREETPTVVDLAVTLVGRHASAATELVLAALHLGAAWGLRDDRGTVPFQLDVSAREVATLRDRAHALRGLAPRSTAWSLEFVEPCHAEAPDLPALAGNAAHDLAQWDLFDRGLDASLGRAGCDAHSDRARELARESLSEVDITVESLSADSWGARRSRSNGGRFPLHGFRGSLRLEGNVEPALPWLTLLSLRGVGGRTTWGMGSVRLAPLAPLT